MKLHTNTKLFKEAISFTAEQLGILNVYVEKDYWLTLALHSIFTNGIGESVIFKGGTALAKCFRLIERFSEDIDLTILRKEKETSNLLKKKLKQITTVIENDLPEIQLNGITNKMGMIRKTAHTYPNLFGGEFGQVRDKIIIESSWLGNFEPYAISEISSYIYEMMMKTEQEDLAIKYDLLPFPVRVLCPERTLCEKIMSLVRFSHSETPIKDLNNKIRHMYDVYKMLEDAKINAFFNADNFEKMLIKVANDDVLSFKSNNEWLKIHPKNALLFSNPVETWSKLKDTYENEFEKLVYGTLPNEADILLTIKMLSKRLKNVNWTITF